MIKKHQPLITGNNNMRIIFFAGKGGVGKTSIAAATGMQTAASGKKTVIISLDIAHSLSDVFDLGNSGLLDLNKGKPFRVMENLYIQELDIQEEIRENWSEIHGYFSKLFSVTGMEDILAEEFAVFPGMEEVSLLLYVNKYLREKSYDVIILDCAPTGESIRFMGIPSTLEWYMKKIFRIQKNVAGMLRPVAKRVTDIPLPGESYFNALEEIFNKLSGVDKVLTDPAVTTVRLVTNPEKIVLKETQRAYMYFSLYKTTVDAVIVNRIYPEIVNDAFFASRMDSRKKHLKDALEMFSPVPVMKVPLLQDEVLGADRLKKLGEVLYEGKDPAAIYHDLPPFRIIKTDEGHDLHLAAPFASKEDLEVSMVGGELFIRLGNFKKQMILPGSLKNARSVKAEKKDTDLIIHFTD